MRSTCAAIAATALALLPAVAWAHGGSYQPPAPTGPRGGGGGPQIPPGTADPLAPTTRWESWWAANKETYLRLSDAMRDDSGASGPTTPSAREPQSPEEVDERRIARAELDAKLRESLVPEFIAALEDSHFEVRTAAAIALGKTGDPRGSEPLRRAAEKDGHKDVRDSAVLGLGLLGLTENVPYLDETLTRPDNDTRNRSFAAFSLGLIGGDGAVVSLQRFLNPREGPRFRGGQRLQPALLSSVYVALGLTDDPQVIPDVRRAVEARDTEDEVRAFAVLSLGRLMDDAYLPNLVKLLTTPATKEPLRRSTAIAIGKIAGPKDTEALDALVSALKSDKDALTRHFSAVALGGIAKDDEALRTRLREQWPRAENRDRPFLALAMGLAKDLASAPLLRSALTAETDWSPRSSYCVALALMGDREAVPLLEQELRARGKQWLQGYAALGLGMLGSRKSAPLLREMLERTNERQLRMNLAVSLGLLHDPEGRAFLVRTLNGEGTIYERGTAAMSLGVLRLNDSAPDLLAVYRNRKEQDIVRAFAIVALGVLADPSPVPKLARFAADNNYAVSVDPLDEVLSIL